MNELQKQAAAGVVFQFSPAIVVDAGDLRYSVLTAFGGRPKRARA